MPNDVCVVGLDNDGPVHRSLQGAYIPLLVQIGYPGSRVTDIRVGTTVIQVLNRDLFAANQLHDEVVDTEGG